MHTQLDTKLQALRTTLAKIGPCAVAFSAGVDSTLLLAVAHEVLGENVVAITVNSPVNPTRELDEARAFCEQRSIRHIVIDINQLTEVQGFADNPPERCYLCKRFLFERLVACAAEAGYAAVLEGSNTDDITDYRPGFAAVQELGVKSPLLKAGLSKQDIRDTSRILGLPTASKQSFACLATRFPYNVRITEHALKTVSDAEQLLIDLGARTVRVRIDDLKHSDIPATARIEVEPADIAMLAEPQVRAYIIDKFKRLGFRHITLDLQGYQTGSMNETLSR